MFINQQSVENLNVIAKKEATIQPKPSFAVTRNAQQSEKEQF
jgi:hypothetical protein